MFWKLITAIEMFCNVLSFSCMRADKRKAIQHTRRIPEKALLLLTFLGPLGTLAAMSFRFKRPSQKSKAVILADKYCFCFIPYSIICTDSLIE